MVVAAGTWMLACAPDSAPPADDPVENRSGELVTGSCVDPSGGDFCGGQSDETCYCDDLCEGYGDCCTDYAPVCLGVGGSGGSSEGGAGGSGATGGAGASGGTGGAGGGPPTPCDGPGFTVFTCQAPSPRGITLANGMLYWADYNGGTIYKANLDGSDIEMIPKPNDPSPTDAPLYIGVRDDKVYWTEPQTDRVRMVRDDGAVFLIATGDNPTFLTLHDDGSVWWTSTIEFGQIYRNTTPFGGAPGQQISYPNAIIPDDDYIYLRAGRIAYEPNGTQGVAESFGATGYYGTGGRFAKDATHTYWIAWSIQNGKHWLLKTPIGGGTTVPLAETAYTNQAAVAVDATHVYYAVETSGIVSKIPKSGGTPQVIASGQNRPWDIAVDATQVYWSNQGLSGQTFSGSVMAAPK